MVKYPFQVDFIGRTRRVIIIRKVNFALIFLLLGLCAGVANSATTIVNYQVSAGADDGFAQSAAVQDTTASYLKIGDERTYAVPYQMSAMRFNDVDIPRSATITSAYLKISSIDTDYRHQIYGVIAAEASDNPADFSGRLIGNAVLTAASVVWDYKTAWSPDTQYISPDISNVVQEVVNRSGFSGGNSIAIYYSTRDLSGKGRSFASYEYSPASAAVLEVTYETYTISGYITTSDVFPLEGVSVSAGTNIEGDVTDATGYYELKVPLGWSGTVTPSKADWGFSPVNQPYSNVSSDRVSEDYTAFQPNISGYVKDGSGTGIEGVSISANNGGGSDTTDATGYYEITVPYDWTGIVTASKVGWNITPSSRLYSSNVTSDQTNQDYTAFQPKISGYITAYGGPLAGVTLTGNNNGGVTTTDANGIYHLTVPYGWSGSITPSKPQYTFTPAQTTYNNVTADTNLQNYTAILPPVIISGYVNDNSNSPVSDVNIVATDLPETKTDSSGYYQITVPYNWTGTVTPNRLGWGFTPSNRSYSNVTADQVDQDFTAVYVGIIVKPDGTGDFATIQVAIDAAVNGDVVVLQPGTFTGDGNRDIDFLGKAITVRGATGDPNNVIIDCQADVNNPHRGFKFINGEDSNSILKQLTIMNGYAPEDVKYYANRDDLYSAGGAIYCNNSSPVISNCIIRNNSASHYGGGICNYDHSNPTIKYCIISDNSATYDGGGIRNVGRSGPIISDCVIINNSAIRGAGISNWGTSIQVGDYVYTYITIKKCLIKNNSATSYGGGISDGGWMIANIYNCVISDNSANYGAGICIQGHSKPQIVNCTVAHNLAVSDGGGIHRIYSSSGEINIANSIIWNNQPYQIYGTAGTVIASYSDIQGGYTGTGNIEADPCFVENYHISYSSPCSNAGDPNYIAGPNETDIDGDPRVVFGIDMGADEVFVRDSAAIFVSQHELYFFSEGKDSNAAPQALEIYNYGAYESNWQIEIPNDCGWLIAEPLSGQIPGIEINEVSISIDHNNFDYGSSSCQFRIVDSNAVNSPQVVTVNLEILGPEIGVDKTNMYFAAYDDDVADQQLMITNTGYDTLNWHIEIPNDCNWLFISPQSGQVTDGNSIVTLSVEPNKAPEYGYNYCTLQIIDPNASNSPQAVEVRLNVYGPTLSISPSALNIYAEKDKAAESAFVITNTGYGVLDWTIEVPNDCNWITWMSPISGSCSRHESIEVTVTVDANGLDADTTDDTHFWIHSPQLGSPKVSYIYLHVYEPNEIHVPYDYPTLQQAVGAAQVYGDTIIVHPGKYAGCDTKGKSLTITSLDPNNPSIVAATIIGSGIYGIIYKDATGFLELKGLSVIHDPEIYSSSYTGIVSHYGNTYIKNCTIKNWPEGGVNIWAFWDIGKAMIENCLISGNKVAGILTQFRAQNLNIDVNNCTITNTLPDIQGDMSGIRMDGYDNIKLNINNSILSNCKSPNDVEIAFNSIFSREMNYLEISNSCLPSGPNGIFIADTNYVNVSYGPGNIEADPCFVKDGYLNDNNTPSDANDDYWVEGDYHLKSQYGYWQQSSFAKMDADGDGFLDMTDFAVLAGEWGKTSQKQTMTSQPYYDYYQYLRADLDDSGTVDVNDLMIFCDNYLYYYDYGQWVNDNVTSPCIDAGDPNSDWTAELWPHGKRINMGAYGGTSQASMSNSTAGNIANLDNDVNDVVDYNDLDIFVKKWCYEELLLAEDLNRDGVVNSVDYGIFANNWLAGTMP